MSSPPAPATDRELARLAVENLVSRLPANWEASTRFDVPTDSQPIDAVIELTAPDGQRATVVVEAKSSLLPREVQSVVAQARTATRALRRPAATLIAARFLSSRLRDSLTEAGVNYSDATGNMRLSLERPALFVRDVGESRDPWRGPGRPRGDLRGPTAARLVRALVDFRPPYTLPELARRSRASIGATYRLADFLEDEGFIRTEFSATRATPGTPRRRERGRIEDVRWRDLLAAWAPQAREKAPPFESYIEPRGVDVAVNKLREDSSEYVVTGSVGASYFASYAPVRLGVLYATDPSDLAERLDLRRTDRGANILLAAPLDPVVFERSELRAGLRVACPSQIAADLMVGPGRAPEEAEALLDWMDANERAWRR